MRLFRLATLVFAAAVLGACSKGPSSNSNSASASSAAASAATSSTATAGAQHVLRATLDNGLKVVIVRDPFAPVAAQQITYFVGANQAAQGFPGMAHAQEHMMFRGAPGLTKGQLSTIIARMGGTFNAFTTNNMTSYFLIVPKGDIDVGLHVGALRMSGVNDRSRSGRRNAAPSSKRSRATIPCRSSSCS